MKFWLKLHYSQKRYDQKRKKKQFAPTEINLIRSRLIFPRPSKKLSGIFSLEQHIAVEAANPNVQSTDIYTHNNNNAIYS